MPKKTSLIPQERIENKILIIREKKVMLDRDLADLYGVETKYLKRQVRRNLTRFPFDFMFQLSKEEFEDWRCQIGTSNFSDKMGLRYPPYAFTEQGVAMISSVLNSEKAINVNIQIMRAFTKLRELMISHKDIARKIETMERKFKKHDQKFEIVFKAIRQLLNPPEKTKKSIGFHPKN